EGINDTKPTTFSLSQNYPNPFNPVTNFQFTVPKSSHVNIEIFNIVGQKVATVVDGDMKAGVYTADWNGRDENGKTVSSGIYFYRMQADDFSNMKKMVLVK
ncbi:MAG: T9SS type A sorting domain-containing protein, partial [Candidatus Zixiibacteriota bacterium]